MRKKVTPPPNQYHAFLLLWRRPLYGAYMHLDGLLQRETDIKYVLLSIQYSTCEYR